MASNHGMQMIPGAALPWLQEELRVHSLRLMPFIRPLCTAQGRDHKLLDPSGSDRWPVNEYRPLP